MEGYKIVRLLSKNNWEDFLNSEGGDRCPAIWEIENGNYVIVGEDITEQFKKELPPKFILGEKEKVVCIPRNVLNSAKNNIL